MFYLGQLFGGIGLIILIISFQNNNKERLLKYQIFSSIFFAIQYICLNALSGCLMNIMSLIRNVIFKKFKEKIPIIFLIITIVSMIALAIIAYDGWISLLPVIAVIIYSISLWQTNLTITRFVEFVSCFIFITYNLKMLAFLGLIASVLELVSVIIAIYKFDIRKLNS